MEKISIVGAGPGSPDLMTRKAFKLLTEAEVVVWTDSLISPKIIDLCNKECQLINSSSLTLEKIISILVEKSKEGKKIVRLHDGDPCFYGALSEQINHLHNAGIKVEVIPGISAYQATAALLQTELTIPGITQTIILSRASGRTGTPERENLEKLASIQSTLCLYLSACHVQGIEDTLLKYYPKDTPVAIGYRVGWDDQWLQLTQLDNMAKVSLERGLTRTTIYLVSPALKNSNNRSKLYSSEHKHIFRPK